MKVLILCTGNSCRSQMAEGFVQSFRPSWSVYSAGTNPANEVHPLAIKVMLEENISLENHHPKHVSKYMAHPFDFVITVCGDAKENCPVFQGKVKNRLHIGFEDPAKAAGGKEEVLAQFRKIRDEIKEKMLEFCDSVS